VRPDARERLAAERLGVGQREFEAHARHGLAGNGPQAASGRELGGEHLRERRGEPADVLASTEVPEPHDGHGAPERHGRLACR
jgi:hypothetical protein